ncbi:MAG: exodeoxyribonuclease VII large subunit, partial [Victivallales bacterium]|nr:exodeoxyribonuclease VII large subunit [Victivallales bacterium]
MTELNECARGVLLDRLAAPLWLQGELGRINCHPNGHAYSRLKDELGATIDIVYFRGARKIQELQLQPGAIVMCYGRVDLFTRDGRFQFMVTDLRAFDQRGALMQRYLETRAKLEAEGLFRPERKRPLPIFPKCIGLLTSANGAAIHDFLETALARIPNLHIRILPVPVQGDGAGVKIARALHYLAANGGCDVIVITRGGGS